jgi:type VI secretion system secreted protein VgrG
VLELEHHPRAPLNQKYLVLSTESSGITPSAVRDVLREVIGFDHEDLYRVRAELLTTQVPFKPASRAAWPRIHSQELAIVDGDADSEYAQLDDQGRYKVKFLFDEGDGKGERASTRVRMMQPHGGNPEGMHFPLRKGTEVVVTFLGGDPDRPIIAGAVPHAETPSPVTSANHTRNILITGGRNKLEIEDLDGQQWIDWYTPSQNTEIHMGHPKPFGKANANLGEHTDGTASFTFGGDWYVDVGGLHDEHVVGAVVQIYDSTKNEVVASDVTESYLANHTTTVTGHMKHTVSSGMTEEISAGLTQTIKAVWSQSIPDGWSQTISSGWTQNVTGGWFQKSDTVTQLISGEFAQKAGATSWIQESNLWSVDGSAKWESASHFWHIKGSAKWSIDGGTTIFTPKLTHVGEGWERLGASFFEHDDFKVGTFVMKAEFGGAAAGYTGAKFEDSGVSISFGDLYAAGKALYAML